MNADRVTATESSEIWRCIFCCAQAMEQAVNGTRGMKRGLTTKLVALRRLHEDIFEAAVWRVPEAAREEVLDRVTRSSRGRAVRASCALEMADGSGGRDPREYDFEVAAADSLPCDAGEEPARTCPGRPDGTPCIFSVEVPDAAARIPAAASACAFCAAPGSLAVILAKRQIGSLAETLGKLHACSGSAFAAAASLLPRQHGQVQLCRGDGTAACIFNREVIGAPALLLNCAGPTWCAFCNEATQREALAREGGKYVTRHLKQLLSLAEPIFEGALARLPSSRREDFRKRCARKRAPAAATRGDAWALQLRGHENVFAETQEALEAHAQHRRSDEVRLARRMPGNTAEESATLGTSALAAGFDRWCRYSSWQACPSCGAMRPKGLYPGDLTHPAAVAVKCRHCARGVGYRPALPGETPEALRGLTREAHEALSLLLADPGPYERHPQGYRTHTDMTRIRWRDRSPEAAIRELDTAEERAAAAGAFRYLTSGAGRCSSDYGRYLQLHRRFLARFPGRRPTKDDTRLRVQALEEVGIECALWPALFPSTQSCLTSIRAADARRQCRLARRPRGRGASKEAERAQFGRLRRVFRPETPKEEPNLEYFSATPRAAELTR